MTEDVANSGSANASAEQRGRSESAHERRGGKETLYQILTVRCLVLCGSCQAPCVVQVMPCAWHHAGHIMHLTSRRSRHRAGSLDDMATKLKADEDR
jgi:hypothetical protein